MALSHYPVTPITTTHKLGLIAAIFTISNSGNATFRIACDTPLNIASISMAFGYFQELILHYSDNQITSKNVYIKTIEFNKDYGNLRLDGVNCITIDNLCAQFKLYQKKLSLRLEHKTKVDFSVQTLTDMLCSNPNTLNMESKINALTKAVAILMDCNYKTTKLIMAMLPKEANK